MEYFKWSNTQKNFLKFFEYEKKNKKTLDRFLQPRRIILDQSDFNTFLSSILVHLKNDLMIIQTIWSGFCLV